MAKKNPPINDRNNKTEMCRMEQEFQFPGSMVHTAVLFLYEPGLQQAVNYFHEQVLWWIGSPSDDAFAIHVHLLQKHQSSQTSLLSCALSTLSLKVVLSVQ